MSFNEKWSYGNSHKWARKYKQANGKQQSPVAIRSDRVNPCDLLCDIAFRFASSTGCHARVVNRTPIITFDTNVGHIKYTSQKQILGLRAMTIHTPSMHTIDGTQYDMEVILYYKLSGPLNPSDPNYIPGGTAVSLLFQRGPDYGEQNAFLNAFIHQLPTQEGQRRDTDIKVGPKWTPAALFPESRSFYSYPGSLPFPPAEEEWNWVVMEEVQAVGGSIVDTLEILCKGNQRTTQPLNDRVVNYNDSTDTPLIIVGPKGSGQTTDGNNANTTNTDSIGNNASRKEKDRLTVLDRERQRGKEWYGNRKSLFQGIALSLVLLLIMYAAYKAAKYIIFNDVINRAIVSRVKKSSSSANSGSGETVTKTSVAVAT